MAEKLTEKQVKGIIDTTRDHATQDNLTLTGVINQLEEIVADLTADTNANTYTLCKLHMVISACKAAAQDLTALADTLDALL